MSCPSATLPPGQPPLPEPDPLWQLVFAATSDGVLLGDASGRITAVNHRATELLGVTADALVGRLASDVLPGGTADCLPSAGPAGTPPLLATRLHRPDGTESLVTIDARVLGDRRQAIFLRDQGADPQPEAPLNRLNGTLEVKDRASAASAGDLAERQRVQAQLRASQERLAQVVNTVPDGITHVDRHGRIVFANTMAEQILRLSVRDITRRSYDDTSWKITTPAGQPFPIDDLPFVRIMRTGQPVFNVEHAIEHPDGTRTILSINAAPVKDAAGATEGMVASITDITSRRQTEDSLRDNEERLRLALAGTNQGLFDLNLLTGMATFTPEYVTMLGYDPADFRLDVDTWTAMLHPDDRAQALATLGACIAGEMPAYSMEYRLRTNGGGWEWVLSSGKVVARDPAGRAARLIGIHYNITARKQAEQALRDTEFFLNKSQEIARIGSYALDIATGAWIGSASLDEIFGLSRDEPKTVDVWTQLVVPAEREVMRRYFEEHVVIGHHRFEREYRISRKSDQQVRWVFGHGEVSYADDGRPLRMMGAIQDITERKQAEEILNQSRRLYEELVTQVPLGVYRIEARCESDIRLVYVSDRYCEITGLTREAILTNPASLVANIHPDDRQEYEAHNRAALRLGQPFSWEGRCLVRGQTRWLHAESRPSSLAEGGSVWTGIVYDVTARKLAEEELTRTSRWLQHTQRISQVGGWTINVRTGAVWVSPEARRIYGADETVVVTLALVRSFPLAVYRPTLDRAFQDLVERDKPYDLEFQIARATGGAIVDIHSLAEYDRAEGLVIGVVHDITERKRAEAARLELERRLLHAQKLESLGVLAGGIAHDFNNLLTAILGNLDLALMDLSPASPARDCIEQSAIAARRAADLTRQMLAYSGRGSFIIRQVDLSALVQENAHLFRACISKLVTLHVEITPGLPRIKADPGQLQQVVMNLITNASESIGDHPGVVRLQTGVMTCDDAALRRSRADDIPPAGEFVFLEVKDTGCGMDEATQQRLFDPFFTTKFTGRGLGMSAILGIVRGHRGAIFVESIVGEGTTIRVLFPAFETASAAAGSRPPPGGLPTAAPAGVVLVVDDEDIVRRVCSHMLARRGWRVLEAADGLQGIDVFRQHSAAITCVVLDLSMPHMSGVEVFRTLRKIRPDVRVILSSGYSNDQSTGKQLMAEGLAGFIQKPYTTDALLLEIERVLKQP